MNEFWKRVLLFMAEYDLDFNKLSKLTDVPVENLKNLIEVEQDDINVEKVKAYVDYFLGKTDWQIEAEAKLYIAQTGLTPRKIEDYQNILCLTANELSELLNVPKGVYYIIYKDFEHNQNK